MEGIQPGGEATAAYPCGGGPLGPQEHLGAIDLDGDGVREVHCNTQEGLWTGLRNFLCLFRGVSKWYLAKYVAVFQWGHNIKRVTDEFLRALLNMRPSTSSAS